MKRILKRVLKWTFRIVLVLLLVGFLIGFIAYWRSTNDCERYGTAPANPMKAVVHCDYGTPDVLEVKEPKSPRLPMIRNYSCAFAPRH